MPNNYLSVLYKHIIQVEIKNVGLKVGGTNIPLPTPTPTPIKKVGGTCPPPPPPPRFLHQWYIYIYIYIYVSALHIEGAFSLFSQ